MDKALYVGQLRRGLFHQLQVRAITGTIQKLFQQTIEGPARAKWSELCEDAEAAMQGIALDRGDLCMLRCFEPVAALQIVLRQHPERPPVE